MRNTVSSLLVFCVLALNFHCLAQTKLTYEIVEKDIALPVESITLKISNLNHNPKSKSIINLELSTEDDETDYFHNHLGKQGKEITFNLGEKEKIIEIPLNSEKFKNEITLLKFILKEKYNAKKVTLESTNKTLIVRKKKVIAIGFQKDKRVINITNNKKKIEIPYVIVPSGFTPSPKDSVRAFIYITGLEGLGVQIETKKEISISKPIVEGKFILDLEPYSDDLYVKTREKLRKLSLLEVKIDDIKYAKTTNYKYEVQSGKNSLLYNFTWVNDQSTINSNTYNFFLGTNFDLQQRFEATSFYSELDVFLPELSDKGIGALGIRAGIYKNNSISRLDEGVRDIEILQIIEDQSSDTQITYETKRVRTTPTVSTENLGLYLEGFRTFQHKKTDNFIFKIMIGFHFELIERKETTELGNQDLFSLGTQTISVDELNQNDSLRARLSTNFKRTVRYYDSYYAITFPFFYQSKSIEVFLNPFIGGGNPGLRNRLSEDRANPFTMFGAFQFQLMEREFGFKLSGEVRKFFSDSQPPIIVINLSKRIDIASLFKSNKTKSNTN
jgi:hypothetical protein